MASAPLASRIRIRANIGFPNSAERYRLTVGGAVPFDCFVRYLDGRATLISVRASRGQEAMARTLCLALANELPMINITLRIDDAPPAR